MILGLLLVTRDHLTACRVWCGVEPDLICQPGPSPGIKTRSSPAAFPTTLSLPFVPFPSLTFLHRLLVPQAAPSSAYSPASPLVPTAAGGKNVAARRLALIHLMPQHHCLIDHLTRASTLNNDADEATRRPSMQDSSPSSLVHQPTTPPVSTVVDQGRVSTPTGCVTTASPLRRHYVVLLPISTTAGFGQGRDYGWQAQHTVGERRTLSGLEYEVSLEKTLWLPKATLDTKLVRRYRAEQRAATRVRARWLPRLQEVGRSVRQRR
jgi:hypothetical protein